MHVARHERFDLIFYKIILRQVELLLWIPITEKNIPCPFHSIYVFMLNLFEEFKWFRNPFGAKTQFLFYVCIVYLSKAPMLFYKCDLNCLDSLFDRIRAVGYSAHDWRIVPMFKIQRNFWIMRVFITPISVVASNSSNSARLSISYRWFRHQAALALAI